MPRPWGRAVLNSSSSLAANLVFLALCLGKKKEVVGAN